jgi:hypothetical protein
VSLERRRRNRGVIIFSGFSVTLGLILLALGLLFEPEPWVQSRPFLVNLVSGLTGALFGIPFALLVIQRISFAQAQAAQEASARRIAKSGAEQLVRTTRRLAAFTDNPDLASAVSEFGDLASRIADYATRTRARFDSAINAAARAYGGGIPPDLDLIRPELTETAAEAGRLLSEIDRFTTRLTSLIGSDVERNHLAAEASASWRFIDDHVKPRLIEVGADWIDRDLFAFLRTNLYNAGPQPTALSNARNFFDSYRTRRTLTEMFESPDTIVNPSSSNVLFATLVPFYYIQLVEDCHAELDKFRQIDEKAGVAAAQLSNQ